MNRAWYEGVLPKWAALLALLYVVLCPALGQSLEYPVDFEVEPLPQEPLTLEQALAGAIRNHPLLQQSLAQVEAQEFAVTASTAPWYPRFSFNASASQTGSENQPGGQNAGSVFVNPHEGQVSAGRLIDEAGLKGMRLGTAQVSTKHANFIQADPRGRADDVFALMCLIADRVEEHHGIRLRSEVRLVGFEAGALAHESDAAGGNP